MISARFAVQISLKTSEMFGILLKTHKTRYFSVLILTVRITACILSVSDTVKPRHAVCLHATISAAASYKEKWRPQTKWRPQGWRKKMNSTLESFLCELSAQAPHQIQNEKLSGKLTN